jgi:hypothetical protein
MATRISELRASFIWAETILEPLARAAPGAAPLSFIGDRVAYESRFDALCDQGQLDLGDGLVLERPWPKPYGQGFWYNYFGQRIPLKDVRGALAWKQLIPLRWQIPWPITAARWPGTLGLEAFFYPHGIALVVTAHAADQRFTPTQAAEALLAVRRAAQFTIQWPDGPAETLPLNALADRALERLRALVLDGAAAVQRVNPSPFSIVTAIRGEGTASQQIAVRGTLHRALHALTTWSESYRQDVPALLEDARAAGITGEPEGHVVYGSRRGRAVWLPALFERPSKVACYHRNLVYAAFTIESLGGLLAQSAAALEQRQRLPPRQRDCAQYAGGIVGRMRGKIKAMYHTGSVTKQIEQNELVTALELVRTRLPPPEP